MSPIVVVKNRQVASLPEMNRLALKKIFDQKNMTYAEEALLDESIKSWSKKIDLSEAEEKQLQVILVALIGDQKGKFKEEKKAILQHGLDYKKVYSVGL